MLIDMCQSSVLACLISETCTFTIAIIMKFVLEFNCTCKLCLFVDAAKVFEGMKKGNLRLSSAYPYNTIIGAHKFSGKASFFVCLFVLFMKIMAQNGAIFP